ncbi:Rv3235 family protein [Streptomyces sp. NPDC057702]|uniref:Rv3235 family protein n=1 Tax=Streptomyces sp. NPDC057702 TaxID=3346221 RepID=UPI00368A5001
MDLAARQRQRQRLPRYWFAQRLLLTLSGQRPVHWMLGHTQGAAYDQLTALAPHPALCPATPAPHSAPVPSRTPGRPPGRVGEARPVPCAAPHVAYADLPAPYETVPARPGPAGASGVPDLARQAGGAARAEAGRAARVARPRAWPPVLWHCDEFRPEPWIIEAFARITAGDRLRALAFRLEQGADERWRCAAIDLGPTPDRPGTG